MSFRPDIGQQGIHRFQRIIGHQDLVQSSWRSYRRWPFGPASRTDDDKGSPEDHDGKLIDHPGLDQGGGLKEFIHCSESSGKTANPYEYEQHVCCVQKNVGR